MAVLVYLDVCCFKRPFDDVTVERIRREAAAVAAILDASVTGGCRIVRSPAHDFENDRNPREDRRLATQLWLDAAGTVVAAGDEVTARAKELTQAGFRPLDALHLAFAEAAGARWFVTTDDRVLARARTERGRLRVDVVPPDEVRLETGGSPP